MVHPGLGNEHGEEKRIHAYYQWVPFMLFFQVSWFYLIIWLAELFSLFTKNVYGLVLHVQIIEKYFLLTSAW